jgi:phosphoribosyl 1,2-cyclic phosphodiesterase
MRLTFWGVRGSIPTPGADTQRYGGNSSCLEIRADGAPPVVLDCGTGAQKLGYRLVGDPSREVLVLFTHLHMDHVFGFPFFLPIYTPGYRVRVWVPAFNDEDAREKLGRYLNGVYHPTKIGELPAQVTFSAIKAGKPPEVDQWRITPFALSHPGGSLGYRLDLGGRSVAYVTDTMPFAKPGEGLAAGQPATPAEARVIEWLQGCDVVVYDTMYDYREYLEKMTWGHSYPEYGAVVCKAAGVKHLVLFHHHPDASDADLDELAARWAAPGTAPEGLTVTVAAEGRTVDC